VLFVYLLLIVALGALFLVLLTRWMVTLTGKLGGEAMELLYSAAEHIAGCHAVPPAWQVRLAKRLPGLLPECADARAAAAHRSRARRGCLRRLGKLIKHFSRTSLVEDERARDTLVSELEQVREEWRRRSWEEMCAPGRSGAPFGSP
jgi:hypothetical protein